ncbi:MAG: hypothetical protein ACP5G1_01765 [Nanopusillaceae archaeon]
MDYNLIGLLLISILEFVLSSIAYKYVERDRKLDEEKYRRNIKFLIFFLGIFILVYNIFLYFNNNFNDLKNVIFSVSFFTITSYKFLNKKYNWIDKILPIIFIVLIFLSYLLSPNFLLDPTNISTLMIILILLVMIK